VEVDRVQYVDLFEDSLRKIRIWFIWNMWEQNLHICSVYVESFL